MAWINGGLVGILLIAGLGTLLLRWRWRRRFAITRHTVRCPLHESPATILVHTTRGARRGWRYLDVLACSLLPRESGARMRPRTTTIEIPCDDWSLWEGWWYSGTAPRVRCRKACLSDLEREEERKP